ncbi:MAG: hypothetical protein IJ313_05430 [Clostridia bacterium]|nr:hypothetical protein [Clostridia bacterium]
MTIFFYLLVIAFLILFPSDTADTALEAMRIWGTSIVPALFPYMVFSRLLCKSLQTLSLPAEPAAVLLGMLGGSPSGAAVIAAQSEWLSPGSVYPLCTLAGTISPMFILGTVQSWTGDARLCRLLLVCHWLSALLSAGIVWMLCRRKAQSFRFTSSSVSSALSNPIVQSIDAILQVGGCIILYSVLSGILGRILSPFPFMQPFVHAALEISGGVHAICQIRLTDSAKHVLLAAALGFGGLSILSQNHALLRPLGIRMRHLFSFAVMRSAASALLMILFSIS